MALKIKVYSDYVCPFCFLGKDQFDKAIEGKEVEVEWLPFELRPRGTKQLDPMKDPEKLAAWKYYVEPRIEELKLNMKLPSMSPHPYTDYAHEGYEVAKEFNKEVEYNSKVYNAFFQEGRDIGNIDILTELAAEVGIEGEIFKASIESRKYKDIVKNAYEKADVRAVPTFIIGDEKIEGAASKEVFERAIERATK